MKLIRASLEGQKALYGRVFVYPWVIGFLVFVLLPVVESIMFSFSDVEVTKTGYVRHSLKEGLWANYTRAFNIDLQTKRLLVNSLINMATDLPLIILFSLFIAVLLNQKFRGRTFARALFFLPVVITSGALVRVLQYDLIPQFTGGSTAESIPMVQAIDFGFVLRRLLPIQGAEGFINYIVALMGRIYQIIWDSGVQILIFLAGLQTIPKELYECASVEGATGWESFWKITFPMISPIILINIVYTVIDSFTDASNPMLQRIIGVAFGEVRYGYSAALAWIYFSFILVIVGILIGLISRRTFYMND